MFDNRHFSFHSLNDRQIKIRLHAVNDTTTAKIYQIIYLHSYKQLYICTTNILNVCVFFLGCFLYQISAFLLIVFCICVRPTPKRSAILLELSPRSEDLITCTRSSRDNALRF